MMSRLFLSFGLILGLLQVISLYGQNHELLSVGDYSVGRELEDVNEPWRLPEPEISWSSYRLDLLYTISDEITNDMFVATLHRDGRCLRDISDNTYFAMRVNYRDPDGSGTREVQVRLVIDPSTIVDSRIISYSDEYAIVSFCLQVDLIDRSQFPEEIMNTLNSLMSISVVFDDNLGITGVIDDNSALFGADMYQCDQDNVRIEAPPTITQGMKVRLCMVPNEISRKDGIFFNDIQDFAYERDGMVQSAIENGRVTEDGLTEFVCREGSDLCIVQSDLRNSFFLDEGVVEAYGTMILQFGIEQHRRHLRVPVRARFLWEVGEIVARNPMGVNLPVRPSNMTFVAEAYRCDQKSQPVDSGVVNDGEGARICIRPDEHAREAGVYMRSVDSFTFSTGGAKQTAVRDGEVEDGRTLLICSPGDPVCILKTDLRGAFFLKDGTASGSGIVTLQFGPEKEAFMESARVLVRSRALDEADNSQRLDPGFAGSASITVNFGVAFSKTAQEESGEWWGAAPTYLRILYFIGVAMGLVLLCCCCLGIFSLGRNRQRYNKDMEESSYDSSMDAFLDSRATYYTELDFATDASDDSSGEYSITERFDDEDLEEKVAFIFSNDQYDDDNPRYGRDPRLGRSMPPRRPRQRDRLSQSEHPGNRRRPSDGRPLRKSTPGRQRGPLSQSEHGPPRRSNPRGSLANARPPPPRRSNSGDPGRPKRRSDPLSQSEHIPHHRSDYGQPRPRRSDPLSQSEDRPPRRANSAGPGRPLRNTDPLSQSEHRQPRRSNSAGPGRPPRRVDPLSQSEHIPPRRPPRQSDPLSQSGHSRKRPSNFPGGGRSTDGVEPLHDSGLRPPQRTSSINDSQPRNPLSSSDHGPPRRTSSMSGGRRRGIGPDGLAISGHGPSRRSSARPQNSTGWNPEQGDSDLSSAPSMGAPGEPRRAPKGMRASLPAGRVPQGRNGTIPGHHPGGITQIPIQPDSPLGRATPDTDSEESADASQEFGEKVIPLKPETPKRSASFNWSTGSSSVSTGSFGADDDFPDDEDFGDKGYNGAINSDDDPPEMDLTGMTNGPHSPESPQHEDVHTVPAPMGDMDMLPMTTPEFGSDPAGFEGVDGDNDHDRGIGGSEGAEDDMASRGLDICPEHGNDIHPSDPLPEKSHSANTEMESITVPAHTPVAEEEETAVAGSDKDSAGTSPSNMNEPSSTLKSEQTTDDTANLQPETADLPRDGTSPPLETRPTDWIPNQQPKRFASVPTPVVDGAEDPVTGSTPSNTIEPSSTLKSEQTTDDAVNLQPETADAPLDGTSPRSEARPTDWIPNQQPKRFASVPTPVVDGAEDPMTGSTPSNLIDPSNTLKSEQTTDGTVNLQPETADAPRDGTSPLSEVPPTDWIPKQQPKRFASVPTPVVSVAEDPVAGSTPSNVIEPSSTLKSEQTTDDTVNVQPETADAPRDGTSPRSEEPPTDWIPKKQPKRFASVHSPVVADAEEPVTDSTDKIKPPKKKPVKKKLPRNNSSMSTPSQGSATKPKAPARNSLSLSKHAPRNSVLGEQPAAKVTKKLPKNSMHKMAENAALQNSVHKKAAANGLDKNKPAENSATKKAPKKNKLPTNKVAKKPTKKTSVTKKPSISEESGKAGVTKKPSVIKKPSEEYAKSVPKKMPPRNSMAATPASDLEGGPKKEPAKKHLPRNSTHLSRNSTHNLPRTSTHNLPRNSTHKLPRNSTHKHQPRKSVTKRPPRNSTLATSQPKPPTRTTSNSEKSGEPAMYLPDDEDICFEAEEHDGTIAFKDAIRLSLKKFGPVVYSPKVYRRVKKQLPGRRFFICDDDDKPYDWREVTKSELIDLFWKYYEEEKGKTTG